jgi:hypothetical protein
MTQRAGTIAEKADFRRDEGNGSRLAFGADHGSTSGGPKRTGLRKSFEGVIQSNGIMRRFSTGRPLNLPKSKSYFHIAKLYLIT